MMSRWESTDTIHFVVVYGKRGPEDENRLTNLQIIVV